MVKPGLPKKYAKMGFKKGWAAYKKSKGKSSKSKSKSTSKSGGSKNVGKKRNGFNTQKLFKYVRLIALGAPAVAVAIGPGTPEQKVRMGIEAYTGYNIHSKTFSPQKLAGGYMAFIGATLATIGIPKLVAMIRGL